MRHIFKLIGRGLYSWGLIQDFPNDWFLFLKLDQQKEYETLFFPVIFFEKTIIFLNRKTTLSDTVFPHIVSAEFIFLNLEIVGNLNSCRKFQFFT